VATDGTNHNYNLNITPAQIGAAILQLLPEDHVIHTATGEQELEKLTKIEQYLSRLNPRFLNELKAIRQSVQATAKALQQPPGGGGGRGAGTGLAGAASGGSSKRDMVSAIRLLRRTFKEPNPIDVNLTRISDRVERKIADAVASGFSTGNQTNRRSNNTVSSLAVNPTFDPSDVTTAGTQSGSLFASAFEKVTGKKMMGSGAFTTFGAFIGGELVQTFDKSMDHFGLTLRHLTKGVLIDPLEWQKESRAVMYALEGPGVALTELEQKYLDIGDVQRSTGIDRSRVQMQINKQLQKGYSLEVKQGKLERQSVQQTRSIVRDSMSTATMINANAEATSDQFSEWNRQLGMSNLQLSMLGRSMQDIQKTTGISGDNLLEAARAANQTINTLRNFSGGVNARSMASAIETQAQFAKFGSGEIGGKMEGILSGGDRAISQGGPLATAMAQTAANMGRTNEFASGQIMQDPNMKREFYRQFEKDTSDKLRAQSNNLLSGNLATLSDEMAQLRKDNPAMARHLQANFQNQGLDLGQLPGLAKAVQEMKSPHERRDEIDAKLKAGGLSGAEKKLLTQQRNDIEAGLRRQNVTEFSDKMNTYGNADQALKAMNAGRSGKDTIKDFAQIQNESKQMMTDMADRAKSVGYDLDTFLKEKGTNRKEVQTGLMGKNSGMFADLLNEIEGKIQVEERAKSDPILNLQHQLVKINGDMKQIMEKHTWILTSQLAILTMIGVKFGLFGMALTAGTKMLGSLLGRGAAAAGGAATAGTAAARGFAGASGTLGRVASGGVTAGAEAGGLASMSGTLGKAAQGTAAAGEATTMAVEGGSLLGKVGSAAKGLGVAGAAVDLGMGGYRGYEQAKEDGGSALLGTGLGVITGDNRTGNSTLGNLVGADKGGFWDKLLGVVGAGGRGALAGGAIGAGAGAIGGPLAAVTGATGAIVGGVTGAVGEGFKLLRDWWSGDSSAPAAPEPKPVSAEDQILDSYKRNGGIDGTSWRTQLAEGLEREKAAKGEATVANLGAFDPTASKEANDANDPWSWEEITSAIEEGITRYFGPKQSSNVINAGLFDPDAVRETGDVDRQVMTANMGEDLNAAVYYANQKSQAPKKGTINTRLYTDEDAETFVASQTEGNRPSGPMAMLPSMTAIENYLIDVQAEKLDKIADILIQIRDRTGGPVSLSIPEQEGYEGSGRPNVRNFTKGKATGAWPIQQPSSQETGNPRGDYF
jgi:hypothetical protein